MTATHTKRLGFVEKREDMTQEQSLWAALESSERRTLLADLPNFAGNIEPIVAVETPVVWP